MAKTSSSLLLFSSLSLLFSSLSTITATCTFPASTPPTHNVKGMFVFGSSYVDNGNNNFLKNDMMKVNYTPYGIDLALGPSGRFNNGKNVIDLLGEELGLPPYIPVFANPSTKGEKIVNGVSFSSGGSGILDETDTAAGVTSLSHQIKNFEEVTLPELEKQLGCSSTESLPNYLFVLGVGGNDYTLNYFPKIEKANLSVGTPGAFTTTLITSLTFHIQKLYDLGARKFMLMSMYPIGCSPIVKASNPVNLGCVTIVNEAARLFNFGLKLMVDTSKLRMPGSNLVYVNAYDVILDIIKHPSFQGFSDTSTACCEMTIPNGLCKRGGSVCANRKTHVYFDGLHPTEAVNKLIVQSACGSNLSTQVYPFNVKQLVTYT